MLPKIEKDDGNIDTDEFDILKETKNFYHNLYNSRGHVLDNVRVENIRSDLKDHEFKTLPNLQMMSLEREIIVSEATEVLKNMKNNKSPGSDGFSAEYLKFFWIDLSFFNVQSLNYAFVTGIYQLH